MERWWGDRERGGKGDGKLLAHAPRRPAESARGPPVGHLVLAAPCVRVLSARLPFVFLVCVCVVVAVASLPDHKTFLCPAQTHAPNCCCQSGNLGSARPCVIVSTLVGSPVFLQKNLLFVVVGESVAEQCSCHANRPKRTNSTSARPLLRPTTANRRGI